MQTKGWEKVLTFTYVQTIKAKSFIISTVVMVTVFALMILGINFLPGMLKSSDSETISYTDSDGNTIEMAAFAVKKLYISNNTDLVLDFSFMSDFQIETQMVEVSKAGEIMDEVTESLEAVALAVIEPSDGGFTVKISRPRSTELVKNSDCYALSGIFSNTITDANLRSIGVAEENLGKAQIYVSQSVNVGGEEPKSEIAESITMMLTMITSMVLFVLIIVYAQLTAQAIATEKASRVMELLLTSVRPLAVIIGKVLATTLVALTTLVGVGGISAVLFMAFAPMGTLGEVVGMVDTTDPMLTEIATELNSVFTGFNPGNILLILLVFTLGFLFYALIAGLIGASISKIEDLQTALQPLMLIGALGFYLTYLSPIMGLDADSEGNILVTISRYLPISSPFALPGAILTGDISGAEIVISIGVLALLLVLFALFVARVYEHIILQNGDRVKIKDMLKLAKK
jgi:ABC-2 type transport system permease protein